MGVLLPGAPPAGSRTMFLFSFHWHEEFGLCRRQGHASCCRAGACVCNRRCSCCAAAAAAGAHVAPAAGAAPPAHLESFSLLCHVIRCRRRTSGRTTPKTTMGWRPARRSCCGEPSEGGGGGGGDLRAGVGCTTAVLRHRERTRRRPHHLTPPPPQLLLAASGHPPTACAPRPFPASPGCLQVCVPNHVHRVQQGRLWAGDGGAGALTGAARPPHGCMRGRPLRRHFAFHERVRAHLLGRHHAGVLSAGAGVAAAATAVVAGTALPTSAVSPRAARSSRSTQATYDADFTFKKPPKGVLNWVGQPVPGQEPPRFEARLYDVLFRSQNLAAAVGAEARLGLLSCMRMHVCVQHLVPQPEPCSGCAQGLCLGRRGSSPLQPAVPARTLTVCIAVRLSRCRTTGWKI